MLSSAKEEVGTISHKKNGEEDRNLKAELNRKYVHQDDYPLEPPQKKYLRQAVRLIALLLAVIFFFTITGRWLAVFSGPAFQFLRESFALSSDPLVNEVRGAVVQVFTDAGAGSTRNSLRGSGFNIREDGLVVTNRHLLENAALVRISFSEHGSFIASKWLVSDVTDLALLFFEGDHLPTVSLAAGSLAVSEDVLVIGNPLQFARIANRGRVVAYRQAYGRELPHLVIEALIYPGSSGSPVFNSQGEVGAIIFATLGDQDPDQVRGLAIDVRELKAMLDIPLSDW